MRIWRIVPGLAFAAATFLSLQASATDLNLDKDSSYCFLKPGDSMIYTMTVANNSAVEAINAVLADGVPSQFSISSITTTQGTCSQDPESPNSVTCTLGNIPSGGYVSVQITVTLASDVAIDTSISNSATVSADNEIDTSNNTDQKTITTDDVSSECTLSGGDDEGGCSLLRHPI